MSPALHGPGRRVLAALIRLYRRRMSGRGPLRRVRCTFERTESCSAYGLRVTETVARSAPEAVRLIRARIRACGSTALYAIPAPARAGGLGLLWGEAFDQSATAHDAALRAAAETEATRAAVLRGHAMIARYGGNLVAMRRLASAARALAHRAAQDSTQANAGPVAAEPQHATLIIRAGERLMATLRWHLVRRLVPLAILAALVWLLAPVWLALVCSLAVLVLASAQVQASVRRARRFDRLAAASRFQVPVHATPARPQPAAGLDRLPVVPVAPVLPDQP